MPSNNSVRRRSQPNRGCQGVHSASLGEPKLYIPQEDLQRCEDLTRLSYLHDETVRDCLIERYKENNIYTWAGPILVAVNPYQQIQSLYSSEIIKHIHKITKEGHDTQIPHVYTIAGLAHHRLTSELGSVNQAILVSGESGAGKTESARFLLKYLTKVETDAYLEEGMDNAEKMAEPKAIRNRILASNPILEAFGNAATLRNHNSSRFGKLINLQYSGCHLKGASLDTYLLEKTRVSHQPPSERNFHIFYQVLAGCRNGILKDLELDPTVNYRITPQTVHSSRDIDDSANLKETLKAFNEMGFSEDRQKSIFQILCTVMHLGNITFCYNDQTESFVVTQEPECQYSLEKASSLLGLEKLQLIEAFTKRKISVPTAKTVTVYEKSCERLEDCEGHRDSLMQLLFVSIFSHLVATINARTSASPDEWSNYMGILDVYGFETFDKNSLEQLCINYANERLQQEFTRRYLASEQRILIEEGFIEIPQVITDNSKCVSALDSSVSVFAILNEECQLRRALNENTACERVCNLLQDTGIVLPPSSPSHKSGFMVRHYAGLVNYASNGLLLKNKDEIPNGVVVLLEKSTNPFVKELTMEDSRNDEIPGTPRNKARKITTLLKFKSSLDSLMRTLTTCDLHYIRCVKPNLTGNSDGPESQFLLDQLNANGILETVKISQAGYPVRMLYKDFVRRYCLPDPDFTDQQATYVTALKVLGDDGDGQPYVEKCRFGRNRVFLSESSLHALENVRHSRRKEAALYIQRYYRSRVIRKSYLRLLSTVKILQSYIRCKQQVQKYAKLKKSAIVLQKYIRGYSVRRSMVKQKAAATLIQRSFRRYRNRATDEPEAPCPSRLSMNSAYGSMSCTTDLSDVEPSVASRYSNGINDPEESGIETDTESLSGEGMKTGRSCRIRSRKQLSSVKVPETVIQSDDGEESHYRTPRSSRKPTSESITASLKRKFSPLDVRKIVAVSSNPYRQISETLKHSRESEKPHRLTIEDRLLYYRHGIVSFRNIPPIKIKFHVRKTCLPYSTCAPVQARSQGLVDAIR